MKVSLEAMGNRTDMEDIVMRHRAILVIGIMGFLMEQGGILLIKIARVFMVLSWHANCVLVLTFQLKTFNAVEETKPKNGITETGLKIKAIPSALVNSLTPCIHSGQKHYTIRST